MPRRTTDLSPAGHGDHERLLIAGHAAGDLGGRDLEHAMALLAACRQCEALDGELRAVALAMRDLPPPVRPAGLDFRIPPDRAVLLARGRGWRRLLGPFGLDRRGVLQPLSATLATLGLAGLLLASVPGLPMFGAASIGATGSAPSATRGIDQDTHALVVLPPAASTFDPMGLKALEPGADVEGAAGGVAGVQADSGNVPAAEAPVGIDGRRPLALLSLLLLGAGIGLFLLRRAALRLR